MGHSFKAAAFLIESRIADADIFAVRKNFTQASEEIRTIAVQLLHTLGQRHVEAAAEVGDLGITVLAVTEAAGRLAVEVEIGGRDGPEPTRYGDWEKNGRCIDF